MIEGNSTNTCVCMLSPSFFAETPLCSGVKRETLSQEYMKPRKQFFSKIASNQQEKRTDKEQYTVEVRINKHFIVFIPPKTVRKYSHTKCCSFVMMQCAPAKWPQLTLEFGLPLDQYSSSRFLTDLLDITFPFRNKYIYIFLASTVTNSFCNAIEISYGMLVCCKQYSKEYKADVSSVSPSSERIDSL